MPVECCPGKSVSKRLVVGGIQVGISEYDTIMKRALSLEHASDDEIKRLLLKELKVYNYIPASAERDYADAMWQAFEKMREEKTARAEEVRR